MYSRIWLGLQYQNIYKSSFSYWHESYLNSGDFSCIVLQVSALVYLKKNLNLIFFGLIGISSERGTILYISLIFKCFYFNEIDFAIDTDTIYKKKTQLNRHRATDHHCFLSLCFFQLYCYSQKDRTFKINCSYNSSREKSFLSQFKSVNL